MKKVLSIVLCLCMFFSLWTLDASAADDTSVALEPDDLMINDEVAYYVAQFFVSDMYDTGTTQWEALPEITQVVPMYDETGENVTAYTVELTQGYVVVSAYMDVPNPILEWADEATPIYESFDYGNKTCLTEQSNLYSSRIIYLGNLDYYLDTGSDTLETLSGNEISRTEISGGIDCYRDLGNLSKETLDFIAHNRLAAENGIEPMDNHPGEHIVNPFTYAKNFYGGTWKAKDWRNDWEQYTHYAITDDFSPERYKRNCGPTAITNMIRMRGKMKGIAKIVNRTDIGIFNEVLAANTAVGGKYYINSDSKEGGTQWANAKSFVYDAFKRFDVNTLVYPPKTINHNTMRNAATSNCLLFVNVTSRAPYGEPHGVVAFAYTNLVSTDSFDPQGNPHEFWFLKIVDGLNRSGRFLNLETMEDCGDTYIPVYFV